MNGFLEGDASFPENAWGGSQKVTERARRYPFSGARGRPGATAAR